MDPLSSIVPPVPPVLLAALGDPVIPTAPRLGFEFLIQTAVGLALFGALLFWAKYLRRKKHKRKRRHRSHRQQRPSIADAATGSDTPHHPGPPPESREDSPDSPAPVADPELESSGHHRRHRRRRPRREHRPRNPTLAETGGLPPRREPGQPPPAH
ncbi:MAG: hypothetical protein H7A45_20655 [Verrucomicrobiales bacterium]|nr:hypothetical protein [Verrucomicrobiales bacterium]MCP5528034.1 hypothetical protein [Verrucomicrobiales bacterium]